MHPSVKYLSGACVGALLLACADHGRLREQPAPLAQVASSADDAYLLGRQHHLAKRFAPALESYQAALRADPRHVNARNGLATLYAQRGEMDKAIALWRALTGLDASAAPAGPASAFLYSNLGYALLLNGEYAPAITALERACVLDPLNPRAWHHLGSALEKTGQPERAQRMLRQAGALEQHDFQADAALAPRGAASIAAANIAAISIAAAPDGWAATEVRQTSNGMFELRRAARPAAVPAGREAGAVAAVTVDAAQALPAATAKLEIRNGNGVNGMARLVAHQVAHAGLRVIRLSNEKRFNVAHTRVEYQGAFRQSARRLAEHFGNVAVVEVADAKGADVRLVIGRDLLRSKVELPRISAAGPAAAAKAS